MKIICGLGNPGEKYAGTRHNAGFIFLDYLASTMNFPEFREKRDWKAMVSEKGQGEDKVVLVKPLTFMNLSGETLQKVMSFYKATPAELLLVYDDVDLPLGTFRYREKGSAGTHNGMRSVIACIGTEDFPRLRLGIESREEGSKMPLDAFVLAHFTGEESKIFENVIKEALLKLENSLAKD